jgi:hypothetical protein
LGTELHDGEIVHGAITDSQGIDTRPAMRNVVLTFPMDATTASSGTITSSIVEESEIPLLLLLRIHGDSDSALDQDLDLRDGTMKGACIGGEARYISRFHGESWGMLSPNVGVDVSSC